MDTSAHEIEFKAAPGVGIVRWLRCGLPEKFKLRAVSRAVFPALFWPVMMLKSG